MILCKTASANRSIAKSYLESDLAGLNTSIVRFGILIAAPIWMKFIVYTYQLGCGDV